MGRRPSDLCSATSLLLLVGVCALWARSYVVADSLGRGWVAADGRRGGFVQAYANRGTAYFARYDLGLLGPAPAGFRIDHDLRVQLRPPAFWTRNATFIAPRTRDRYLIGFSYDDGGRTTRQAIPSDVYRDNVTTSERWRIVSFPLWAVVLAFGFAPARHAWRTHRRRMRRRRGLCQNCGYDLRMSRDRCPECGAVAAGASRASVSSGHSCGHRG